MERASTQKRVEKEPHTGREWVVTGASVNRSTGDPSPQDVLATARRYVKADLSVIPLYLDGSKRPDGRVLPKEWDEVKQSHEPTWKPFQVAQPTDADLVAWFGKGVLRGIGITGGKGSRKGNADLEIIDCDAHELWPEWVELIKTHQPGLYERLTISKTGGGGDHALYRCEEVEGNLKLAMRAIEVPEGTKNAKRDGDRWITEKTLFETRGQGGQIVAPGSPLSVHDSGQPYKWIQGDETTIPTMTPAERELLLGLARALNEYHPKEEKRERTEYKKAERCNTEGLKPGDDYSERGDPLEVLLNHGWTISHQRGSVVFLKKPGAKGKGHHATLHAVAHNVFYNFSTSVTPFDHKRGYSAFQVYALLEHNGDFKAAAKALAAMGYGEPLKVESPTPETRSQLHSFTSAGGTKRIAAEMDDIILLCLAEFEEFTDQDKLTLLALFGIFGNRQKASVSRATLARRIKNRIGQKPANYKSDDQYGGRRLTELRKALKRAIKYPIVTLVKQGKKRGYYKNGKPKPNEWAMDMKPFTEALALARTYYQDWCDGKPAFEEWAKNGADNKPQKPNVGKTREKAAQEVMAKYRKSSIEDQRDEFSRPPKDAFALWIESEKSILRAAIKMADALEDLGKTIADKRTHAGQVIDRVRSILLRSDKRERRRMLEKLKQVTDPDGWGITFMHEGYENGSKKQAEKPPESVSACSHKDSVNTYGDMQDFRLGPAIYHAPDGDIPVEVIGDLGVGPDGLRYVSILDHSTGIPLDRISYDVSTAATTGDPLLDAYIEDMEAF